MTPRTRQSQPKIGQAVRVEEDQNPTDESRKEWLLHNGVNRISRFPVLTDPAGIADLRDRLVLT